MRQRVILTWAIIIMISLLVTYIFQRRKHEEEYFNSIKNFESKHCQHTYGKIAIVQLVTGGYYINKTVNNALLSLRCYAKLRNYTLFQIRVEDEKIISGYSDQLQKKAFSKACQSYTHSVMTMRHCIVAYLLQEYDYIVHLDGDTGVVNPNHCFEEYITPSLDMTLLMRVHTGEIQAGNYIVKSTEFSRRFFETWLNNTQKVTSFDETLTPQPSDQDALHRTLSEFYLSKHKNLLCSSELNFEEQAGYFSWVKCIVQELFRKSKIAPNKHIKIYNRAHGFVRDGWFTKYTWSSRDFLFHAMKHYNDVLFDRLLSQQDCISNTWEIPIKGEYYVPNQSQMERIWNSIDEKNYENFKGYALISKISGCWPYCQNIIL